jgi:hypothetical protein
LALTPVESELPVSASLPPREKARGTHLIGGWMGPRTGLDDTEK